MSQYKPVVNPALIPQAKMRSFYGLGGEPDSVFKIYDSKGNDISNGFLNEILDMDLGVTGSMKLRAGCRKISDTGFSGDVEDMFPINLGNRRRYGVVVGGSLSVIDIPDIGDNGDPIELTPAGTPATVSNEYPIVSPEAW